MSRTCQHCGVTTDDGARVMCPSCGRRMRPRDAAPRPDQPAATSPPYGAPPYGAPPPRAAGQMQDGASRYAVPNVRPAVLFDRAVTRHSSRLKVAFRLILVLPHLALLAFYGIGAGFAVIGAWFAALFVARVPDGLYDFIGRYFSYYARVTSYTALLTDRWPTLSNDDPYPVVLRLPGPGRLNRAAVFFRLILVIPANFVASAVAAGAEILGIVAWFAVLIAGRMPVPLFDAYASTSRYVMRTHAYTNLLTATYPAGLFGDPDDGTDAVGGNTVSGGLRTPVVQRGARAMLVLFIVVGGLSAITGTAFRAVAHSARARALDAASDLSADYHSLDFGSFTKCSTPATEFSCYVETARQDAQTIATFQEGIRAISFPANVRDEVVTLNAAVQEFRNDFEAIAGAKDRAELKTVLGTLDLQGDGQAFDNAVSELGQRLEAES